MRIFYAQSSNPFLRMINRSIEFIPQQFVINNLDNILEQSINETEPIIKPTNKEFIENIEIKTVKKKISKISKMKMKIKWYVLYVWIL